MLIVYFTNFYFMAVRDLYLLGVYDIYVTLFLCY